MRSAQRHRADLRLFRAGQPLLRSSRPPRLMNSFERLAACEVPEISSDFAPLDELGCAGWRVEL